MKTPNLDCVEAAKRTAGWQVLVGCSILLNTERGEQLQSLSNHYLDRVLAEALASEKDQNRAPDNAISVELARLLEVAMRMAAAKMRAIIEIPGVLEAAAEELKVCKVAGSN